MTPIMEDMLIPVDHIKTYESYIVSLRERLGKIGAIMWLEDVWTPNLQRDNDRSIMATIVNLGTASAPTMVIINKAKTYHRVITIADLVDATGKYIQAELLCGKWRAGSDLKWPKAAKPGKKAWSEFRMYIREAFFTGTIPYQSTRRSM